MQTVCLSRSRLSLSFTRLSVSFAKRSLSARRRFDNLACFATLARPCVLSVSLSLSLPHRLSFAFYVLATDQIYSRFLRSRSSIDRRAVYLLLPPEYGLPLTRALAEQRLR